MAALVGRDSLPGSWSYGVCGDGRVFFINDDTRTTTWLHPRSGEPVNSGHMIRADLPEGWEEGFTEEGASFFIDHNQRTTTFRHPVTGQISAENMDFVLQERRGVGPMMSGPLGEQPSSATISEASTTITSSTVDSTSRVSRPGGKLHSFGKRDQAIQRNPSVPVVLRGWLYKRDSSGMRLWKRKWFVLADFCLFYYKDSREEAVLGSIPLPSYVVSLVEADDHISRKFTFKAEHAGMRTYYFSADTQEDLNAWLKAMKQATLMQHQSDTLSRPSDKPEKLHLRPQHAVPQTNHISARRTDNLDSDTTRPIVHKVLLEPIPADERCFPTDSAATTRLKQPTTATEMDTHTSLPSNPAPCGLPSSDHLSASAPVSRVSSRAPSRAASTLPSSVYTRNVLVSTPSPILEPNGIAAGTYQRAPSPPPAEPQQLLRRRSALEEVEQWVQVQRAEHKAPSSRENTLPRPTPPTQHKFTYTDAYRTLPRTPRHSPPPARLGEYKYAQDRLSHFRLTPELGGSESNTVWQLYEWQQRHQFRHGSPTAPLYTPAPDYPFGLHAPSTLPSSSAAPRSDGHPRCVSVPPSTADVPPPGPQGATSRTLSPSRRPHTPAERVTVRPAGNCSVVDAPFTVSPRRTKSQLLKAATMERRSMPPSGYITHTVSAPSLHGKTADDTYLQLKKDLDYLDLKVAGGQTLRDSGKPVKVAESDVDVKLSRLCEQDKILKDLEMRISSLKEDKDKLESVLDLSHQQMEQYLEQPSHSQKIAYQQRLLQEDLVSIRAQISRLSTEMSLAWEEYGHLERSVEQLRTVLQAHMSHSATPQDRREMKRELWRIEDVLAGLSGSKENYRVTIDSVQNPERKLVPSSSAPMVPSFSAEVQPPPRSILPLPQWAEDAAPPRPPLPRLYDYEDTPPVVPPLPREASVIRHTSVRGLKRQSERKRDRDSGLLVNGDWKIDLRSYLSEPELTGSSQHGAGSHPDHHYLQNSGAFGPDQSVSVSSFVTLRKGPGSSGARDRPLSALDPIDVEAPSARPRGRMTAEEQLERMKRHQRALVRERKRNLSQGERSITSQRSSSADPPATDEPLLEEPRGRNKVDLREANLEPLDYDLDISRELSKPQQVLIPERYVESDPEEPLSPEELQERSCRAQRIKKLLARSSVQNYHPYALLDFSELELVLQQQEKIMNVSHILASEASQKSRLVAAKATAAQ